MGYTQYGQEVLDRIEERSNKNVNDVLFDAIDYTKENGYNNHYAIFSGATEKVYVRMTEYDDCIVLLTIDKGQAHEPAGWRAPINSYNTKGHLRKVIKQLVANCR